MEQEMGEMMRGLKQEHQRQADAEVEEAKEEAPQHVLALKQKIQQQRDEMEREIPVSDTGM